MADFGGATEAASVAIFETMGAIAGAKYGASIGWLGGPAGSVVGTVANAL